MAVSFSICASFPPEPPGGKRIALAVALSVVLNAFAVVILSWLPSLSPEPSPAGERTLKVTWRTTGAEPAEAHEESLKEPPVYVEANPDGNREEPKETLQESFQNQVAAQEIPVDQSEDEVPTVEGAGQSLKIVEGSEERGPTVVSAASPVAVAVEARSVASEGNGPSEGSSTAKAESPDEGDSADAMAPEQGDRMALLVTPEGSKDAPETTPDKPVEDGPDQRSQLVPIVEVIGDSGDGEGPRAGPLQNLLPTFTADSRVGRERAASFLLIPAGVPESSSGETGARGRADQPQRSRPRVPAALQSVVPAGPLAATTTAASRAGEIAISSRLTEFGVYAGQMNEAIYQQWLRIIKQTGTLHAQLGTYTTVRFVINPEGKIIEHETTDATVGRTGQIYATEAIVSRAPFGKWTDDMRATLGSEVEVSIRFWYGQP